VASFFDEDLQKQYGLIHKFFLIDNQIVALIKIYKKKTIHFPELSFYFEFNNNLVYEKIRDFYVGIEKTEDLKLIKIQNIISKCVTLEIENETILTEVVKIDEHD
jgi:hypothetical protein